MEVPFASKKKPCWSKLDIARDVKFLDADVERPLAFVSAVVDEGNVVVFGLRVSSLEKTGSPEDSDAWKGRRFFMLQLDAQAHPNTIEVAKHDEHTLMERTSVFRNNEAREVREHCKTKKDNQDRECDFRDGDRWSGGRRHKTQKSASQERRRHASTMIGAASVSEEEDERRIVATRSMRSNTSKIFSWTNCSWATTRKEKRWYSWLRDKRDKGRARHGSPQEARGRLDLPEVGSVASRDRIGVRRHQ